MWDTGRKQWPGDDAEVFFRREYDKGGFHIFYVGSMSQLLRTEKVVKIRNKMFVTDWSFHCVGIPGELSKFNGDEQ